MSQYGPILIVDDDSDDQELMVSMLNKLNVKNELLHFRDAKAALLYLLTTKENPFLILCDIKMPGMSGMEFRLEIMKNEELRTKSIPFVFFTGGANASDVEVAYELVVQGFFIKAVKYEELERQVKMIIDYWKNSLHPNTFYTE